MTVDPTLQATYAATLVDEWVRAGVTDAVVAPGSRSTPLALALAEHSGMRVSVHHDERSAGFLALGMGLATDRPAVVLTTSGTAAVELHPAVVEASQARVPLLAVTADRPAELHDVGAPQVVDQTHLFGRAVRWFCEPGVARSGGEGVWRSLAARAVAEATDSPPGPVHINLAFDEPLTGWPAALPDGRADGAPWHATRSGRRRLSDAELDELAGFVSTQRGVIVAGAGAGAGGPDAVHRLAAALGWPVLADPRSGCRVPDATTVAAADAILRSDAFAAGHRPEVVLRLGAPPASKVLAGWLSTSGALQVAVDAHGAWWDPDRTAAQVVTADPTDTCQRLADAATDFTADPAADDRWLAAWTTAEGAAQGAIETWLDGHEQLTEMGVARRLVAALSDEATLVTSSSMPVRDVEWYAASRRGVRHLANRGANGIDGVVSTAVGVALAGQGPTAVLVGDVALLHDTNALLGVTGRGIDLTLVVVDNRGGGIFSFLPQARSLPSSQFELLFGTPHHVDLPSLLAVHGVPVLSVVSPDGYEPALAAALGTTGVQAVVVRTDRTTNVVDHEALHRAVIEAVDALP